VTTRLPLRLLPLALALPLASLAASCEGSRATRGASPPATAPSSPRPETSGTCAETPAPTEGCGEGLSRPEAIALLREAGIDPARIACNQRVEWDDRLDAYAKKITDGIAELLAVKPSEAERGRAIRHALGYLVRSHFESARPDNLGVMRLAGRTWVDEAGKRRPLLVFRSGLTFGRGGPSACFKSLVENARVRHVVNLYAGSFPFQEMIAAEGALARQLGATYEDSAASAPDLEYRGLVESAEGYEKNFRRAEGNLARLVRDHLLAPSGAPPRGNLYFHCAGGMHRSGILFAVLRRCVNRDPWELIESEFKRHVAYESEKAPGGFEPRNLRFVREFDCSLLEPRGAR
jgi:hypothetical protein